MNHWQRSRMQFDLNVDSGLEDIPELCKSVDIISDSIDEEIDTEHLSRQLVDSDCEVRGEVNYEQRFMTKNDSFGNDGSPGGFNLKDFSADGLRENRNPENEDVRSANPSCAEDVAQGNANMLTREIEKRLMVGSIINDLEQAYLIYCEYGRCKGFGVRKGEQRFFGKSNEIKWKDYVCCCAGINEGPKSVGQVKTYKKLVLRSGCKAKLRVARTVDQPWRVKIFETEHNHGLVPSDQTYMLRSSRNLSYAKQSILEALTSAGIGVSGACGFMERECGGPQNLGFTRQDAYDHLKGKKKKTKLENSDSIALLEYFNKKSNDEPFFYWKIQLDDDHRIMNFFFRDSRCAEDYRAFGDVLSVDTTHKTNCYNLICAPFVGMNHHSLNVLFGIGFLSDETSSSFEWLFGAFLESMGGIQPKVIFTDQCKAMMNAIDKILPNSKHRLCQWHINRNAAGKFGSLNGNPSFKKLWNSCMNEVETEAEFDEVWKKMSEYKDLKCKNWFNGMYNIRHRWASVFTRGIFTAGMLATSRSEATNRVLKALHRSSSTLYDFVRNYEEVQARWRRNEREEDTLGIWNPGQFVSNNDLFSQAASVYTRNIYKWFETEATRALSVIVSHHMDDIGDRNLAIRVRSLKGSRPRKIIYNKDTHYTTCSYRMFESEGILCRHIIKVYYFMNVFSIPDSQILKRWTKRARDGFRADISSLEIRSTLPGMLFLNTLLRQVYDLASPCIDHEDACLHILKQIEILGAEVLEIMGIPKPKPNSTECNDISIKDPKPILERFFSHAGNLGHTDQQFRAGRWNLKKPKKIVQTPLPFVPSDHLPNPPGTAPPKVNLKPIHGSNMLYDDSLFHNYSQP